MEWGDRGREGVGGSGGRERESPQSFF